MIKDKREQVNKAFSAEKYDKIKDYFQKNEPYIARFRISETPIFLDKQFGEKLHSACESIIDQIESGGIVTPKDVPSQLDVPRDNSRYHFLAMDFGICENQNGELEPQLIELQAFPSLFYYQMHLADQYQENFQLDDSLSVLPNQKFDKEKYKDMMHDIIVADVPEENVILMEINPKQQKTAIDFLLTQDHLGIEIVNLSEIWNEGDDLYYIKEGVQTPIYRIYNRVIFDELENTKDYNPQFKLTQCSNMEWITHPNWFFKISKTLLPRLKHEFVPKAFFANEFPATESLNDYVLKPLFSFAGKGVNIHPEQKDLDELENPENYILQQKVQYAAIFQDPDGEMAKAEIRMLYIWPKNEKRPVPGINLVRMTKSEKVNVDHLGQEKIWTGSSIAFFES
ncbi:MAG: hypothetical protein Q4F57_05095 [Weeksellaceae bacterium]|nr:hypothetical protein [Weeksellaceae bacterium]